MYWPQGRKTESSEHRIRNRGEEEWRYVPMPGRKPVVCFCFRGIFRPFEAYSGSRLEASSPISQFSRLSLLHPCSCIFSPTEVELFFGDMKSKFSGWTNLLESVVHRWTRAACFCSAVKLATVLQGKSVTPLSGLSRSVFCEDSQRMGYDVVVKSTGCFSREPGFDS